MKKSKKTFCLYRLPILAALMIFVSCQSEPNELGKWQAIGGKGSVEFKKDNVFIMIDNSGGVVKGNYLIYTDGHIDFSIIQTDIMKESLESTPHGVISGKISITDDKMELVSGDGDEVEEYMREY